MIFHPEYIAVLLAFSLAIGLLSYFKGHNKGYDEGYEDAEESFNTKLRLENRELTKTFKKHKEDFK